jgi:hypothetical protein
MARATPWKEIMNNPSWPTDVQNHNNSDASDNDEDLDSIRDEEELDNIQVELLLDGIKIEEDEVDRLINAVH